MQTSVGGGDRARELLRAALEPLARRLDGVHPTVVSALALLSGCAAGAAYWLSGRHPAWYLAGGALAAVSALADGLDGVMARRQGRASALGDLLDHFFDRLVEVAILVGLASSPHATATLGLAVLVGLLLSADLGTQIHASFGARHYTGLGKAELYVALAVVSVALGVAPAASLRLGGLDLSLVDAFFVLVGLATVQALLHRLRLAVRLAGGGGPR